MLLADDRISCLSSNQSCMSVTEVIPLL